MADDVRKKETEVQHRKSGTIENAVDAFHLVEWLTRTLCDELQDRFGRGLHVEVRVDIRDINRESGADD